jgi:membrane-bound ClpP family serine protease
MSIIAIILIISLGFVLFLIEFLVIPGISVAGIAAILLVAGGVICGYVFHGHATGNLILIITGVSMFALFITILKMKTWRHVGLKSTIDGRVGSIDDDGLNPGDEGITVSKLSPIGKALIKGKLFEVRSDGNYIDANKEIIITHMEGNKIYIKTKI